MCPFGHVPPEFGFHLTDEELLASMERMENGAPTPANIITDVNPCDVLPWNSPENMWYFFHSDGPKTTETGYWKATGEDPKTTGYWQATGEDHMVLKNSPNTGWKTTLEFYTGEAPNGIKTNWMMHEYRMNQKEGSSGQGFNSLCRVFLNHSHNPKHELQRNHAGMDNSSRHHTHLASPIMQDAEQNNNNRQDQPNRSQVTGRVNENRPLRVFDSHLPDNGPEDPIQGQHEIYDFSKGDYLELLDLVDPESPSSSSENSSCLTMSSDEYFDSWALLQDLDACNNQGIQQKNPNCKLNVFKSVGSNKIVVRSSSSGSLHGCDRSNLSRRPMLISDPSLPGSSVEQKFLNSESSKHERCLPKLGDTVEGLSSTLENGVASSSGLPAASRGKGKAVSRMSKLKKKYWCFMPF
ncbi:PREDICTED: NAC domain-containing protein 83-like [Nelumbo nucifera]|uniref:NAC domain-containing protein 83-like n=1 Tax=Nelumbo nucifera TaxID=4432 RepID=A0A1U7ZSC7_NELNU|nr:PREDICTED: NAC domain-containing protein 83-like [Nelumbo nucifera]